MPHDPVIARFTARRAARSGVVWGAVFAASIAGSASAYSASFPTAASRERLARSFGNNPGVAALIGPARNITTVQGFTAWRATVVLSVLGSVWGLLAATRLLRGEEDAGRWETLLAGPVTRRGAAGQALAGLWAGWLTLYGVAAVGTVLVGRSGKVGFSVTTSLYMALTVALSAAVFLAVGAVAAQLAANRRQANIIAAVVLGASYLARMAADTARSVAWLRWASPIGWAEEARPLVGPRPSALLPALLTVAVLATLALHLAAARDLGAGTIPSRDSRPPRLGLLGNANALSFRLSLPAATAWSAAMVVVGLMVGLVAQSAADALSGSTVIEDAVRRLGGSRSGAASYLGLTFVIVAALLAVAAVGHISSARAEESEGRLDLLLVRSVSRWQWFAGRLAIASAVIVVIGTMAGLAAWAGAATQHSKVGLGQMVVAGLNTAPPGLLILGLGALLLGVQPRSAVPVAYALVAWSLLVELVGSVVSTNRVLLDSSVLHHIAPAPATAARWSSALAEAGIGLLAALAGMIMFGRRDITGA